MIIGICGFQSSGKDTIANYLINHYGFKKLSFAGALKDIVSIIFSWPRDKLEGLTMEDRLWREQVDEWWSKTLNMPNLTPRFVLQYFGTDLFRNHWHQDIWVKVLERKLLEHEHIVVTDCRYDNEINLLRVHGGKIIHIYRNMPEWFDNYKNNGIIAEEMKKLHVSETGWIKSECDFVIENNGTLEELQNKIISIMEKNT